MIEQERAIDDIDRAANYAEAERQARIQHAQSQLGNGPQPTGRCLNCTAPIPKPKLYCDGDCASDHHARQQAAQRLGRSY